VRGRGSPTPLNEKKKRERKKEGQRSAKKGGPGKIPLETEGEVKKGEKVGGDLVTDFYL